MSQQTNINFKMDKQLKEELKDFCDGAGLTISVLFNMIAKNIVANHKIPFTITDNDPIYSQENIARIKAISKEVKEGKYHELNLDEEV